MHICKYCKESDLSKFSIRARNGKPYNACKKCASKRAYESAKIRYTTSVEGKELKKSIDKKYHLKNKDSRNSKSREWYSKNKEHVAEYRSRYRKTHRDQINLHCAKRRAIKKTAAPNWGELNDFIIQEAYSLAALRTELTGVKYVCDHIVPLNNPLVSGLHVGINLQVITEKENIRKSNKHTI